MTTIVYRAGVLAADSLCRVGDWNAPYAVEKLFRMKDGSVCGVCGNYTEALAFIAWLNDGKKKDVRPPLAGSTVVQATAVGVIVHESEGCYPVKGDFGAWGSGLPVALGALHMGATAEEAVNVAALVDEGTGGAIVSMKAKQ